MKALEILELDVRKLTTLTDIMLIATGTSSRHVSAIVDHVLLQTKHEEIPIYGVEGKQNSEWVLVDYGDLLVHVMQRTTRELYQLEKLWTPIESDERVV
ncbi:MAG: ribosome silencing factor [Gammaproteobacteria bacterium]|nr:ribosome silencing factor [Gammaproteobacteria bacterium]MYF52680.1 ribosome silencing factor [Gammaproteobacteria bacterium]MYK43625.1 ribosome silencing factor [Gammaproteobacteria bacterium]